jgi:hypothetical protein
VRLAHWAVVTAAVVAPLGACAAISGLDQYSSEDCATGGCTDATPVADRAATPPTSDDTTGPDGSATDDEPPIDDAGTGDNANADTGPQTGGDCGVVTTMQSCGGCGFACDTAHSLGAACTNYLCTYDACVPPWVDCDRTGRDLNGCESNLSSTMSCGACGVACDTDSGSPACNNGTCTYTCRTGRFDCDYMTSPNTDGCECTGGCCPNHTCQITHSTGVSSGVSQTFPDCMALGTWNITQAMEACAAFTGDPAKCAMTTQACPYIMATAACSSGTSQCYCWYLPNNPSAPAPPVGQVQGNATATCASLGLGTWPCPNLDSGVWN